ncbi:TIGR00270 family protein [Candidatus Micrarchaeota archaeon]|nr:TIGR00270 family protein [Candidatus Micrarchaeota archaeon]
MADCELCGRNAAELYLISLENAKLSVCEACSSKGEFIGKIRLAPEKKQTVITSDAPEEEIIDNYADLIREKRDALGISLEDFAQKIGESASLFKKIETGKMTPSERTASKIQKILGIKLYRMVKKENIELKKKKATLTLADVVKIKEKRK